MTNNFIIHPALILIIGAIGLPFFRGVLRKPYLILIPVLTFLDVIFINNVQGINGLVEFMGKWQLIFGRVDSLSIIFAFIMSLMTIIATIYGLHEKNQWQHMAAWLYAAGSLGVIYAGDYLVVFLFWELMAFASTFLIWFNKDEGSLAAGYRYLLVHTFGGIILLLGFVLRYQATGNISFILMDENSPQLYTWLIMIGLGLNAAMVPFHSWLPDAYSKSSITGGVFMCAFTTKTAVYTLARGFAGFDILIIIGVIMAIYGIIYALRENDVRKLLGWEIISQVGYMVAGVGIGTALAINGTAAHAFAHILYKGLLFMGAGAIISATGSSKLTELGGLARKMPYTMIFMLVGCVSVSAFPFFSGFVSKSMIIAASYSEHIYWAGFLLTMVSVGTFVAAGLRLPWLLFFSDYRGDSSLKCYDQYQNAKDPSWNMTLAMMITAVLCLIIGVFPGTLYSLLPQPEISFEPYTDYHIGETLQILAGGLLVFCLLKNKMYPANVIILDLDWFYRKGGRLFLWIATKPIQSCDDVVGKFYRVFGLKNLMSAASFWSWFDWNILDYCIDGFAKSMRTLGQKIATTMQRGQIQQNLCITVVIIAIFIIISL